MRTVTRLVMALALGALLFTPNPSTADSTGPMGGPIASGSWTQNWYTTGTTDKIEAFIVSGPSFESPGMNNFSDGSWSGSLINPDYALATGNVTAGVTWDTIYSGSSSVPFIEDVLVYLSGTPYDYPYSVRGTWDGSSWTIGEIPAGTVYDRTAVPLPPSAFLLVSGLTPLAWVRRKKGWRK